MKKGIRILAYVLTGVLTAAFIVGDIIAYQNHGIITMALGGNQTNFEGEGVDHATELGDQLCRDIEEEGVVLLKNGQLSDGTYSLPLGEDVKKVNVFGWGATQFLQKGVGSGSSSINPERSVNFLEGLEQFGISYNKNIVSEYTRFSTADILKKNTPDDYKLYLPTLSWHQRLIDEAKTYSDTALLVLHRVGGENIGEIPLTQTMVTEVTTETDSSRTYLETTKHEDDLIDLLAKNFKNVVLVLNTTNSMHLPCLVGDKIKSAVYVGITGQSGAASIPHVLWGYKNTKNGKELVSPSGKLTDLYSYQANTSASFANYIHKSNHIQYLEDIYYGYRWYETADAEGYWDGISNSYGKGYDGVVQFPFGYGLSYTEFKWSNMVTTLSTGTDITKDSVVTVKTTVENIGNYPGKDVVELYVSPSYKKGGIEKPSIHLVDFAKTDVLAPGESQEVELSFSLYDIASYDCYDKNENGFAGYELDYGKDGKYTVKLMSDSHHAKTMNGGNEYVIQVPAEGFKYENDVKTGVAIENRMTGANAYAGVPIDGSTVGAETKYLTRADFASSFPSAHAKTPTSEGGPNQGPNYTCDAFATTVLQNTDPVDSGLRLVTLENGSFASTAELSGKTDAVLKANESLIAELSDYDNAKWETLLNQMSIGDLCDLIENGGFHTYPIESIGKIRAFDTDGPAGFNLNTVSLNEGDASKWTAYPSETLIGCTWNKELAEKMGLCMGLEAQATTVQGWYAPGVNLHRTPYTARNYEYYSEDPLLSGVFAAKVIIGAKTNGLYCYLKHFVLSEPGPNPRKLNTWCTEQNLRENYLKPFEIAVKEGGANAMMSAFNRVGSVWAGASYPCLTQILRNEWGFRGSIITDYAMADSIDKGNMNPEQGVKAGNDLWLNPNDGTIAIPLNRNDPTTVNAARTAVKNIVFTFVDTYYYATNNEPVYQGYSASISVKTAATANPWWIPTLIAVEATLGGGTLVFFGFALFGSIKAFRSREKKEKVAREKRPFYISKRMVKMSAIILSTGLVGAILCLVLIPLFTDILVDRESIANVIPVDKGDVFAKRFEFEHGLVNGKTIGEDHLCVGKSYYYDMNLSESGALTNLQKDSTVSFSFLSSKKYKVSMNIRISSVFDEGLGKYVEKPLGDYLDLKINEEVIDLTEFVIPAFEDTSGPVSLENKDMGFVDVCGIPVTISNISNTYQFTLKEGCPGLDFFAIYTSAEIMDYEPLSPFAAGNSLIRVKDIPTKMHSGVVEISCPEDGCEEKGEYDLPLLTGKKWYSFDEAKNAYSFFIFNKPYVITPDTADKAVGTIHSESKVINNFSGSNFFQGSNWNHQSSTTRQKAEDYVYTMADLIDANGNVVLEHSTPAKTKIFYCDSKDRKPLTDYKNAANKDYLGKKIQYSFLMNATNGFVLNAFSTIYSDENLLVKNSVPGVFFKFDSDGNIALTIGVNDEGKDEKKVFRTPNNFISAPSAFIPGEDFWLKFEFTRYTPERFELALFINNEKVIFPGMPDDSTGNINNRYTENGNIYIVQNETNSHTWGEYISVAPDDNSVVSFKDLNYGVGV